MKPRQDTARIACLILSLAGLVLFPMVALGQTLGTAVTYQGLLKQSGAPFTGTADLECKLFSALSGGTQVGSTVPVNNVAVADGLFTASLDFGTGAFNGDQRFLEFAVRSPAGAGSFTTLSPRQPIAAAPYALYALSGPGSGGPWAVSGNNVFNTNTGNVGIGTTSPTHSVHIRASIPLINVQDSDSTGAQHSGYVRFADSANTERGYVGYGSQLNTDLSLRNFHADGKTIITAGLGASAVAVALTPSGNVGVGTTTPVEKLDVRGGAMLVQNLGDQADLLWLASERSWVFRQEATGAVTALKLQSVGGGGNKNFLIETTGNVGIGTLSPAAKLDVNGTTRTKVLEITGADLAEKFPASGKLDSGMVVAIDKQNPGKLCLARGAYNRCVAGIVSGANNFAAGAVLGNLPGHEDAPPVALSGRVYVHCDASQVAIEPGDLLTTADIPGHAMKVTDYPRAQGAIIGKAMEPLERGQSLILVLVNLQ